MTLCCAASLPAAATGLCNGTTYKVGPGQPYPNLTMVGMKYLVAGDTVEVHWRQLPYREKFVILAQGTQDCPVRIKGVRGGPGPRPR